MNPAVEKALNPCDCTAIGVLALLLKELVIVYAEMNPAVDKALHPCDCVVSVFGMKTTVVRDINIGGKFFYSLGNQKMALRCGRIMILC